MKETNYFDFLITENKKTRNLYISTSALTAALSGLALYNCESGTKLVLAGSLLAVSAITAFSATMEQKEINRLEAEGLTGDDLFLANLEKLNQKYDEQYQKQLAKEETTANFKRIK